MPIVFQSRVNSSPELTPVGTEALEEDSGLHRLKAPQYRLRLERESGEGFPQRLAVTVLRAPDGTLTVHFDRGVPVFEQLSVGRPLVLSAGGEASRVLRWSEGPIQREERLSVAAWAVAGRLTVTAQFDSTALASSRSRKQPSTFVGQLQTSKGLYVGSAALM